MQMPAHTRFRRELVLPFAALVPGAVSALAHHSNQMFDSGKVITLQGTIEEFQYTPSRIGGFRSSWIGFAANARTGMYCLPGSAQRFDKSGIQRK